MEDKNRAILFDDRGNPKGGKISGKDTECVILSSDYKLPDENHVLLRASKENNMYNVDLKNVVSSGDLTYLFTKATLDEFNLWHRSLGKQHIASCKSKPISSVSHPLQRLHVDLFGPTFVKSLNKKTYYLVVTDDYSRVLVTKPHNTTPYELLLGRSPSIGFMRPFGCPVTILNTLDPLEKFDGKADEGFLVGYSVNRSGPKSLFDIDTLTQFMNYQPVVAGNQPNHNAVIKENLDAGKVRKETVYAQQYVLLPLWSTILQDPQNTDDAAVDVKENENDVYVSPSGRVAKKSSSVDLSNYLADPDMPALEDIVYSDDEEDVGAEADLSNLEKNISVSPIPTTRVYKDHPVTQIIEPKKVHQALKDPSWIKAMQEELLQFKIQKEEGIDYDEVFALVARIEAIRLFLAYASFMGFMNRVLVVKPYNKTSYELFRCRTPALRFMRPFRCHVTILNTLDHLGKFDGKSDDGFFIGYSLNSKAFRAFRVYNIRTRKVEENLHIRFLENTPIIAADGLKWLFDIDALTKSMNYEPVFAGTNSNDFVGTEESIGAGHASKEELIKTFIPVCFLVSYLRKNQKRMSFYNSNCSKFGHWWIYHMARAIGTKWIYRNKKDERGIMVINKARLVAQVHTQEEGINYDEVFAPVARIKAIRLFLAYALFKDFVVYQMDVKSAFLYGRIEEEVYVCQPPRFEDLELSDRVYKVKKELYGLHQAPRAWYETLSTYLLDNRFHRVKRIFRYLKGQPKLGLWYPKDLLFDLEAYTDTDYAGASLDRKSTTGAYTDTDYAGASLDRKSTTGEYVAASNYYGQVLWIQNQILDYGYNFMNTKIFIDNESTICIVKNLVFHSKTKHIEIRHHFIRDSNEKKLIQMIKIHIDHNVADLLTKAFDVGRFQYLIASIRMLNL
nr:retrovirus-related Pol polyprotein from transposon TNT 1-94 [Tanacetum cinerariifolium]